MEFLTLDEVRERSDDCRRELDALLSTKALVGKPRARQWRFLRECVRRLLDSSSTSEFDDVGAAEAAQLKFEVEDKLQRFYLRPGRSLRLVFTLAHESAVAQYGIATATEYPRLAGYCVLVRDLGADHVGEGTPTKSDLGLYLERVVTECIDAEFAAYEALPEIRLEEVRRWFCADGPAMKEIANVLARHREKGWVISNALNPSTKRLLSVRVKKIDADEAILGTTEYWYLRWWDSRAASYTYPYRETNRQLYVLRREPDGWRVFQNLRPAPRSSVPHRWREHRKRSNQFSKSERTD